MENIIKEFNKKDTLLILTSFPERGGEVAVENAVARYANLLVTNFPGKQKVVVICEKRNPKDLPYNLSENILVYPAYRVDSNFFALDVATVTNIFDQVVSLMVQFEFSIFGGKGAIPQMIALMAFERARGKYISIMLHQVVSDINSLSGHLGLAKYGLAAFAYNWLLYFFYKFLGLIANKILVHDKALARAVSEYTDEAKIVVIPHGMNSPKRLSKRLGITERAKLGLGEDEKVIMAFGYKSWYKGTDWIVKTMGQLAKKYPERKLKLVLAGGESPTLKETNAYRRFSGRLNRLISVNKKNLIETGFVPEAKVESLFAAADIIVFPYRTKMSASGALSLAFGYGKAVLASQAFSDNYREGDAGDFLRYYGVSPDRISYSLNIRSFERALFGLIDNPRLVGQLSLAGREIAKGRSWPNVAQGYLDACLVVPGIEAAGLRRVTYAAEQV